MPARNATLDEVVAALGRPDVLTPEQLREVQNSLRHQASSAQSLVLSLVERDWITRFEAELLLSGDGPEPGSNRYRLLERLGEGGVCRVFKSLDRRTGRVVALKVLRARTSQQPENVLRFQREIRAALKLDHPNVVKALDGQASDQVSYLAMEYVIGQDLGRLVHHHGPLPVSRACDYLRQAALGLQHAHEHGLIHRDIKPQNLLLTEPGRVVKVLDLGLVRVLPDTEAGLSKTVTAEGIPLGTPDYMAPEQARDPRRVDVRADIYSLGCTLYFLLLGEPPFAGGTAMQKLFRHQREEPPPLHRLRPAIPPALSVFAARLTAKKPEERFATPAQVAGALAPFCDPAG
jgi:serine/threonine-protein kinase